VNFNFHAEQGNAVPTPEDAPGSVKGFNYINQFGNEIEATPEV